VFPTQIEEQILRCPGLAAHYQIEVTREGRLDAMRVLVEAREDFTDAVAREAQGELLCRHVKELIGVTAAVRVVEPGAVERSLGKAKRVIDRRPEA
jgi:phenylacetate-CoA ligase